MNIKEFADQVGKLLKSKGYEYEIRKAAKNNGVILTGIHIIDCDTKTKGISPILYLENFRGISPEVFVEGLIKTYEKVKESDDYKKVSQIAETIKDFSKVRNRLSCKIVEIKNNKILEQQYACRRYGDFLVIPIVLLDDAVISITDQLLSIWGVPVKNIWRAIFKDLERTWQLKAMDEIIKELNPNTLLKNKVPAYVLTNKTLCYGASVILNKKVLRAVAEKCNGSFYLIPSSIHEWIIIPTDREDIFPGEFENYIKQVNYTCVDQVDILSDKLYVYDTEREEIRRWLE